MDKKKFKNFMYYNWKKFLIVIFLIGLTAVTLIQCSSGTETELGILYAGEAVPGESLNMLGDNIKDNIKLKDGDKNGEITLLTTSVTIPKTPEMIVEQQVMEQIQFEIISGENTLYIINKYIAEIYCVDRNFLDISSYARKYGYGDDNTLKDKDGTIYAVSVSDNALLNKLGLPTEDMYIAIRNYLPKDKNKTANANAVNALKYILGGNNNGN